MWKSESSTRPIEIEKFNNGELWLRNNIQEVERIDEEGGVYIVFEYDETMTHTTDPVAVVREHFDTFWDMCEDDGSYKSVDEYLRARRQSECFTVCDRPLWLDSLTHDKLEDIKAWRILWLAVTETLEIPPKPHWL